MVPQTDLVWVHFSILISFDWWFYLAGEKGKGRALSSFPVLPRLAGYLAYRDQDPGFPPEQGVRIIKEDIIERLNIYLSRVVVRGSHEAESCRPRKSPRNLWRTLPV